MPLFQPDDFFADVTLITPTYLQSRGIRALVLDVDNTLTSHGSQHLPPEVERWLALLRENGIALTIASNNFKKRVEPFANRVGLDFVSFSLKPLSRGLRRARAKFGLQKGEMALVGDQIFTDCLAANLYGITMLMVRPRAKDTQFNIILKRKLEIPFLNHYYKKGGSMHE